MKLKLGLLVSVVALGVAAFASTATPASAATSGIALPVGCTTATGGACTVTLTGFQVVNGTLQAVLQATDAAGNLIGTVTAPVTGTTGGQCTILDLTVGPINLDLLGLVVQTNTIHLQITAQQGPGNLLGNLLCGLANALNGGGSLTQIANILNRLLGGGLLTAV
jgi:hypothetical protein